MKHIDSTLPTLLLIDGDILLHKTLTSVEKEIRWENDIWTLHVDPIEAQCRMTSLIQNIKDNTSDKHSILLTFSSITNFRKQILPSYKANRKSKRKPLYYRGLLEWVTTQYTCMVCDHLEADDLLGILASSYEALTNKSAIIATIDKDLRTVPCIYYDIDATTSEVITPAQAERMHKYQTLIGDSADNYKGCPAIGATKASRLLDKDDSWEHIRQLFKKASVSEEDLQVQAQIARICHVSDFNFKTRQVILWKIPTASITDTIRK